MHAEQSQAMKGINIQVPFEQEGMKRRPTIRGNKNSKKFDHKECEKNLKKLEMEDKVIELLKPAVRAHKDNNYSEMIQQIDDIYKSLMDDSLFSEDKVAEEAKVHSDSKCLV